MLLRKIILTDTSTFKLPADYNPDGIIIGLYILRGTLWLRRQGIKYMGNKILIIISGPPGAGKTTLGEKIAEKFCLPFISKDGIKELLFDSLGIKDREWSKNLGISSYGLLYYFLESLLRAGNSLIVESNFKPEYDSEKVLNLVKQYGFTSFQVQCKTNGDVLLERFKKRSESSERHSGHADHLNLFRI